MPDATVSRPLVSRMRRDFSCCKSNARRRGIAWRLSFDEWRNTWLNSGRYEQRGKCRGQYQMDRVDPSLGYETGNIQIISGEVNRIKDSPHGHVAKLTEEDVISIRRKFKPRVVTYADLAKRYGVTKYCIKAVLNRRNWSSVP